MSCGVKEPEHMSVCFAVLPLLGVPQNISSELHKFFELVSAWVQEGHEDG